MKQIIKTFPPEGFVEYCKSSGVSFNELNGETKVALRKRLLEDQGYICCYCGCELCNDENTKIEHIKCQKDYKDLALDFNNMLASCDGGDKDRANRVRPKHQCHCDAKKGNEDIPISPLDNVDGLLMFFDDGTVKGTGVGKDLIRILGLDAKYLVSQRKNAIENYDILYPEDLKKEIDFVESKHDGKYIEYCFVLKQHLIDLFNEPSNNYIKLSNMDVDTAIPVVE